jgi:hypothetical protein
VDWAGHGWMGPMANDWAAPSHLRYKMMLSWPCEYCGKAALMVGPGGIIFCSACGMSDGSHIGCPRCRG